MPAIKAIASYFNNTKSYTDDKFNSNSEFKRLEKKDPKNSGGVGLGIAKKADSVLGIRNLDIASDLWERLRDLPGDLKPLHEHLMGRIEALYLPWVSKALQVTRAI